MKKNVVWFAHGKESSPRSIKIKRLSKVARSKGFEIESPDYSKIQDPDERVRKLLTLNSSSQDNLVLVGSSMGGYVSTVASEILKPKGLFLLAPAFYLQGYENRNPIPRADFTIAIHGWNDEIIPVENVIRFASQHKIHLYILDSDHRLITALPVIEKIFSLFLDQVMSNLKL